MLICVHLIMVRNAYGDPGKERHEKFLPYLSLFSLFTSRCFKGAMYLKVTSFREIFELQCAINIFEGFVSLSEARSLRPWGYRSSTA
jgi:hypothetical protein